MKRFLSMILVICIVLSAAAITTFAAWDGSITYLDFTGLSGYLNSAYASEVSGAKLRVRGGSTYSAGSAYADINAVADSNVHGGVKLVLENHNIANNLGAALAETPTMKDVGFAEIGFELKLNDMNAVRLVGGYDCYIGSATNTLFKVDKNGKLTLGTTAVADNTVDVGDNLSVKMRIDMSTGDLKAKVWVNDVAFALFEQNSVPYIAGGSTGDYNNTPTGSHGRLHLYQQTTGSSVSASSEWSNVYVKKVDNLAIYKDAVSYDFNDFEDTALDGTAVLTGFTTSGSGVYAVDSIKDISVQITSSGYIKKAYSINAIEAALLEFSVMRPSIADEFEIKSGSGLSYAKISADGSLSILGIDTEIDLNDSGKWYDIKLALNAADGLAYAEVYGNSGLIGSKLVKDDSLDLTASDISFVAGSSSSIYLDDITFYETRPICEPVAGDFKIAYSTPITHSDVPLDTDVTVIFTNEINQSTFTSSSVKVNGVGADSISFPSANAVTLSNVLTDADTNYKISFEGVKDTSTNSLTDYIEFSTTSAKKDIEYTPVKLRVNSSMLKAVTAIENNSADDLDYIFALAKYSSDGSFAEVDFEKDVLSDGSRVLDLELSYDASAYYEAYVINAADEGHYLIGDVASYGTEPTFATGDSSTDMTFTAGADGRVYVSGIASADKGSGFLILKPGMNADALASRGGEAIAYLKFFGTSFGSEYSLPISGSGDFVVLYANDGTDSNTTFFLLSNAQKAAILDSINSAADPDDWDTILTETNSNGMGIDRSLYLSLTENAHRTGFSNSVVSQREALSNGEFTALEEFKPIYNAAVIPQLLNKADNVTDFKNLVLTTYKDVFAVSSDASYPTYTGLSDTAKGEVWTALSNTDYQSIADVQKAFRENTVLSAIKNLENNVDVNKIITDNDGWLLFDMTKYNALTDKSPVNDAIGGKDYATIAELKDDFETLSANPPVSGGDDDDKVYNPGKNHSPSVSFPSGSAGGSSGNSNVGTQTPPQSSTPGFKDIETVPWAKNAIEYMCKNGIINGKSADSYAPDDMITRAEYIKILAESFFQNDMGTAISFADVPTDSWFYPYVAVGVKHGITFGKDDGSFGANDPISRQDMAVMLARAAKIANSEDFADFADIDTVSDYAKGYVSALYNMGVVSGMGDGTYQPMSTATRAQAAVMIYNYLTKGAR